MKLLQSAIMFYTKLVTNTLNTSKIVDNTYKSC